MKILATKTVLEGSQINVLHKENDTWLLISKEDFDRKIEYDEDNMFVIDEEYLYSRIPNLKGKLNQSDKTTINIDYSTGEISVNPQHFHFGIPTHGAKATRQANAGFSLTHYLTVTKSNYKMPIIILSGLLIAGLLLGWFFYIPLALYGAYKVLELSKTRDMYYSGALNPAIVLDAKTNKIASLADLTLGSGSFPIIRVRKYPLPKKYRVDGLRIPVAGTYQNTEDYNHWNYYEPNPLPSGIKDDEIIQEKIASIPTIEWISLQNEINKFDGIPKEGYYPINIEYSNWKDKDLDKIEWMQFGEEK
jgi:hypothetical protein